MPASFLHGIEVLEVDSGPVPVTVVKSAVIGLVGTAPSWAVAAPASVPAINTPTLVSSARDAANFGPLVRGYTIPYALAAIQNQGAGQAIVVNVFRSDPAFHLGSRHRISFQCSRRNQSWPHGSVECGGHQRSSRHHLHGRDRLHARPCEWRHYDCTCRIGWPHRVKCDGTGRLQLCRSYQGPGL